MSGLLRDLSTSYSSTVQLLTINGETIAIITLFGDNRHQEVTEWHRRVMVEHFRLPVNYIKAPFPACSHGSVMNEVLRLSVDASDAPDYYLWLDNDAIFLRKDAMSLIYSLVCNKITLFGQAWESRHKRGPNGFYEHPYASQAMICFSRKMYNELNRPDMDHWISRSDTAEEMTYEAEQNGYILALAYPSHSVDPNTPLGNGCSQGFSNTYGPAPGWFYHCSQAPNPRHVEVFIDKCKQVLAGAFEPTPSHA